MNLGKFKNTVQVTDLILTGALLVGVFYLTKYLVLHVTKFSFTKNAIFAWTSAGFLIFLTLVLSALNFSNTAAPSSIWSSIIYLVIGTPALVYIGAVAYHIYRESGIGFEFYVLCIPLLIAPLVGVMLFGNLFSSITYIRG